MFKKLTGVIFDRRFLIGFTLIYLIGVLVPFQKYGKFTDPAYQLYFIAYCIWTFVIVLHDLFTKTFSLKPRQIVLYLMWLGLAVSLLVKGRPFNIQPIIHLVLLFTYVYVYFSFPSHYTKKQTREFMKLMALITAVIVTVMALVSVVAFQMQAAGRAVPDQLSAYIMYYDRENGTRYAGLFGHPTLAGCTCTIAVILLLYLIENKFPLAVAVPCWVILGYMIYLSRARTHLVMFAVLLLAILIFISRKLIDHEQKRSVIILWVIVIAAGLFLITSPIVIEKISGYIGYQENTNAFSAGRVSIWRAAWDGFMQKPWFGWGFEDHELLPLQENVFSAHNIIMSMLYWSGLAGSVPFLFFIVVTAVRLIKRRKYLYKKKYYWIAVLVVCCFVECLFDPGMIGDDARLVTPWFWLAVSLI